MVVKNLPVTRYDFIVGAADARADAEASRVDRRRKRWARVVIANISRGVGVCRAWH